MRYLKFAGKFVLAWLALGLVITLVMELLVVPQRARERLERRVGPVRLENVELGPALQQLADTTQPGLVLSMCPDVSASHVSFVTSSDSSLEDFVVLLAKRAGAEVDLARSRHGSFAVPYPHLYFTRSECGPRSFVQVHARPQ